MRAAAYARISYDPRTGTYDEGVGVDTQEEDCRALVERHGWSLVDVYVDNSRSAYDGKERPAWKEMLGACVEGRVDVVVAQRDDRLWRDVVEERQVGAMLAQHGVQQIAFASGRIYNLTDVDDKFTSGVHALVAEHESAVKAVRVRRALEYRAAQGRWRGGTRPYGYRRPTTDEVESGAVLVGGLVIVDEQAEVLTEIAQRTLTGESLVSITRDLQARSIPTSTGRGQWSSGRLRELLTNPLHAGLNHFRGEVLGAGRWEPILDRPTHEALVAMFAARRRREGRRPTRLLTGLLRCYRCGHRMSGNVRKGLSLYQCKGDAHSSACGGPCVSSVPADDYVRDVVLNLLADTEELAKGLAGAERVDLPALVAQLTADEQRLDELIADFYATDVPRTAYVKARERLETRINVQRKTLAAAAAPTVDAPVGDLEGLVAWWEESPGQRRPLVAALIERINLKPWEPRMGRRFNPDRLEIVWAT